MGQDDIRSKPDQFRRMPANLGGIASGPAGIDPEVAADGPAQQRQPLQKRPDPSLKLRIVRGCVQEYADAPHALALLRARRERPRRRCTTQNTKKFASSHARPRGSIVRFNRVP